MPKQLETGWKRIGRSGDTIDGREIKADDIYEVAEAYDPEFYTALIWPDHKRWYGNLGKVSKLRAEKNKEGGVDLFAKIVPNDYYLQMNDAGQRLFTSMELFPNFRKTGKHYLNGLGATDNPASVATAEMIFSSINDEGKDENSLLSQYTENTVHDFNDESEQEPSWLTNMKNFFNKDSEADMSKANIEKLQNELTSLADKVNKFTTVGKAEGEDEENTEAQNFSELSKTITDLVGRFTAIETKLKDKEAGEDGEDGGAEKQYSELKDALEDLTKKFNEALEENDGTTAGEDTGSEDLNEYV